MGGGRGEGACIPVLGSGGGNDAVIIYGVWRVAGEESLMQRRGKPHQADAPADSFIKGYRHPSTRTALRCL